MVGHITIFFVPISEMGFCHKYFVFTSENHRLNKFHINVKIDR
jgi:hypothetical protein